MFPALRPIPTHTPASVKKNLPPVPLERQSRRAFGADTIPTARVSKESQGGSDRGVPALAGMRLDALTLFDHPVPCFVIGEASVTTVRGGSKW